MIVISTNERDTMITTVANPEYISPMLYAIIFVAVWVALAVVVRRNVIKARRAEREAGRK
jgi:ABC-type microcin C transport system permease subunit YejE